MNKECKRCGDDFKPETAKNKYCREIKEFQCKECKQLFKKECNDALNKYCNRTCLMKNLNTIHNKNTSIACGVCNDKFTPRNKRALYCNKTKQTQCIICTKSYTYTCSKQASQKYCSQKCVGLDNLQNKKKTYTKTCYICQKDFKTTTKNKEFCGEDKTNCIVCGEIFTLAQKKTQQKYCSTLCVNLKDSKTKITKELINNYNNPDKWAKDFKKNQKRKPTPIDYSSYFGLKKITPRLDRKLLKITRTSLEDPVYAYLLSKKSTTVILRRTRPLKDLKRRLEIDIYLPELSIGFEIQDFKTHHKNSDSIKVGYSKNTIKYKNGPTYHEFKRRLAKEQLNVRLIDLWEDQILDGSYKTIIDELLEDIKSKKEI